MRRAYEALHAHGAAHSLEVWLDGELAGGIYGVAIGRAYFGESMFSRATDGSKIAIVFLARQLARWGVPFIDCQVSSDHLISLGARELPRRQFLDRIAGLVDLPAIPSPWRLDPDLPDRVAEAGHPAGDTGP
jgi:leucyl/phenylalanyl-tRNA--protein transferase